MSSEQFAHADCPHLSLVLSSGISFSLQHPPQATSCSVGPGKPTECRGCASLSSQRKRPTTWRAAWRLSSAPWRRPWRRWARKRSRNTFRRWPSAAWTSPRSCLLSAPSTGGRLSPSSITLIEVRPLNSPLHLNADSQVSLASKVGNPPEVFWNMSQNSLVHHVC